MGGKVRHVQHTVECGMVGKLKDITGPCAEMMRADLLGWKEKVGPSPSLTSFRSNFSKAAGERHNQFVGSTYSVSSPPLLPSLSFQTLTLIMLLTHYNFSCTFPSTLGESLDMGPPPSIKSDASSSSLGSSQFTSFPGPSQIHLAFSCPPV